MKNLIIFLSILLICSYALPRDWEIDEFEAYELANKIPAVIELKESVEKINIALVEKPTEDSPEYIFKVYEEFPDHITTYGWYSVDAETGEVYDEITLTPVELIYED